MRKTLVTVTAWVLNDVTDQQLKDSIRACGLGPEDAIEIEQVTVHYSRETKKPDFFHKLDPDMDRFFSDGTEGEPR